MLLICFIIQFVIACVCLAIISSSSQYDLLETGWTKLNVETKRETEFKYNCCGFNNTEYFQLKSNTSDCPPQADKPCFYALRETIAKALKATGIIALIFSFTNVSK